MGERLIGLTTEHNQLVECAKAIQLEVECSTSLCQFLLSLKDMCKDGKSHDELAEAIDAQLLKVRKDFVPPTMEFFKKVCVYSILNPDLSKSE